MNETNVTDGPSMDGTGGRTANGRSGRSDRRFVAVGGTDRDERSVGRSGTFVTVGHSEVQLLFHVVVLCSSRLSCDAHLAHRPPELQQPKLQNSTNPFMYTKSLVHTKPRTHTPCSPLFPPLLPLPSSSLPPPHHPQHIAPLDRGGEQPWSGLGLRSKNRGALVDVCVCRCFVRRMFSDFKSKTT